MTTSIGVWEIDGARPQRLLSGQVDLEAHLEAWIEQDPALVQAGLTIVGRQVWTEGGPLDLLAIDPQGRWVVIEIKRGQVLRDTIAQALDYASCIARMSVDELREQVDPYLSKHGHGSTSSLDAIMRDRQGGLEEEGDQRDIDIIVVGTGTDRGLERMVEFLSRSGDIAITVVSFQVFETAQGNRVLVRELTESDVPPVKRRDGVTLEDVYRRADSKGTGQVVRRIVTTAEELGLYPRPWKSSVMLAPP